MSGLSQVCSVSVAADSSSPLANNIFHTLVAWQSGFFFSDRLVQH